nr:MAG TPA: tail completion protein [Caudoviricetes sp.]
MIQHTEKHLYDFLKKIMENKGFNVYRGFLPQNNFEDRENGKKTNEYFPFVILRVLEFLQEREGINSYNAFANFEIWIGTKEDKEEDYLNNLAIGDYIREKLLEESTVNGSFAVDQSEEYKVTFYSDASDPYFYSRIEFTVYAEPITSKINVL